MDKFWYLQYMTDIIHNEYDSFVEFSFNDTQFNVKIITPNGKKYGFGYNTSDLNEVALNAWLESIPNQFRDKLVKEALGKEQYYNDNVRDCNTCE